MMIIRIIGIAIVIAGLMPFSAASQSFTAKDSSRFKSKEARGNRYFKNFAYTEAIEAYEKLLGKGYHTDSLYRNLAISWYKIGNTGKSESLFRELLEGGRFIPSDMYYYIQSLKYNEKYKEADEWMEKYITLNAQDSRGPLQRKSESFVSKLKQNERYTIQLASFNSENSDFGAVDFDGNILFSSSRRDQAIIRFEDVWKKAPYFSLYKVRSEDASVVGAKLFTRKFNAIYNDGPVCFNSGGNEILVTRNNYLYHIPKKGKEGVNNLKILTAKKIGMGTWSLLKELPFNNDDYSCGHPTLTADDKTLFFASDMPGGLGGTDIYYSTRTDSGWLAPVNLGPSVNTEGDEMFPFIQSNGLLYFASNGREGMGGLDLYVSRKNGDGTYSVKNMGYPINSSSDDFGLYLRADSKTGFFASNREGGKGDDDIYSFRITAPVSFGFMLTGTVNDSITGDKLNKATIQLIDEKGKIVNSVTPELSNEFSFPIEENTTYSVRIDREGYISKTMAVSPLPLTGETIKVPVLLNRVAEYGIFGNVYIKGTSEIVPDVTVKIYDNHGKLLSEKNTEGLTGFRVKLEPNTDYQVVFSKPAFLTKRVYYSTKGRKPGYVNINEFVEVAVQKLEVGAIIEIPNIYYDLAKWNIRPDAAIELEKVVQFLNDNPTILVELGSHTDCRGSDVSNQVLSQKRAESAVAFIVQKGIDVKRIVAKGYGESKLKNRCANGVSCSEEEHQQNRRTEIKVMGF